MVWLLARGPGGRQAAHRQQPAGVHLLQQVRRVLAGPAGESLRQASRVVRGSEVRQRPGRTGGPDGGCGREHPPEERPHRVRPAPAGAPRHDQRGHGQRPGGEAEGGGEVKQESKHWASNREAGQRHQSRHQLQSVRHPEGADDDWGAGPAGPPQVGRLLLLLRLLGPGLLRLGGGGQRGEGAVGRQAVPLAGHGGRVLDALHGLHQDLHPPGGRPPGQRDRPGRAEHGEQAEVEHEVLLRGLAERSHGGRLSEQLR